METTRHFTASVYLVEDGAVALHDHKRLGLLLPAGGHVDRDELPHETALREAREETGLDPTLLVDQREITSGTNRSLPRPRHLMLADVNVYDGHVGHQHVDHVYYATVDSRAIDPAPGEEPADAWGWYDRDALGAPVVDADVRDLGREAIDVAARA